MPAPTRSRSAITPGTRSEALVFIERAPRLIRPINYPAGTPGRGAALIEAQQRRARAGRSTPWAASSWTRSTIRSPRSSASLPPVRSSAAPTPIIIDIHGEATSEKQAMGYFCDGRASLVVGTHTHAPTADHRILPGGTAFMSDVGMTGDYDSVIGMNKDEPLQPLPAQDSVRPVRAGDGPGDVVRGSRSRPTTRPGWRTASRRCGSAAQLEEARPAFWELGLRLSCGTVARL